MGDVTYYSADDETATYLAAKFTVTSLVIGEIINYQLQVDGRHTIICRSWLMMRQLLMGSGYYVTTDQRVTLTSSPLEIVFTASRTHETSRDWNDATIRLKSRFQAALFCVGKRGV